jgi:hypothetical protein
MKILYYQTGSGLIHPELATLFSKYVDSQLFEAPRELKRALENWDGTAELNGMVAKKIHFKKVRILIAADQQSKFHSWCLSQCSHAHWGCSNGYISIDYSPIQSRLYNQLHECFHFLGVKDCYAENIQGHPPKVGCDNDQCVMRFGNNHSGICSNVKTQLADWANKNIESDY